ncbi:MAG: 50S ribosomal protein L13 [Candidatus Vogelbacteria bacterium]|nr:50S ribosomal protein L13 [Candidatus Vogelbacteria bacterium]
MEEHTIDAEGRSVGRVASEAAQLLRGKHLPSFAPYKMPDVRVMITNASRVNITERKLTGTAYTRYSGYPGGLRSETMGELAGRKGFAELFRIAVRGMLPNNRLRDRIMKNLSITE